MATKVGINGFGRIGRQVLKIMKEDYPGKFDVVAFNDLGDLKTMAHLFKYDSNYGIFKGDIEEREDGLVIDGDFVEALSKPNPETLPWKEKGVEIVIEATGRFRSREDAAKHLSAGARKVIITAPAKKPDITIVIGVNDDKYDPKTHHIVSNASCTTNCLAPAAKVVQDTFGIEKGLMTTIHSYTNDQMILDLPHKDLRRARAAALNIIPTTTGAAKAVALVIPELEGKFDGFAMRVPTPTVSVVDLVVTLEREGTTDELHEAFRRAAEGPMKGILGFSEEPLVSMDYKMDSRSSVVDAEFTFVMGGNMAKVMAWYDNEWGYSVRTVDLAAIMAKSL
ncbi:MAG: type I glyceraldehyde-3-phosphate dehydrogenase [Chloroflexi bacterium RBG_16_48_8]|nr:MAG: type I glyceraldehyde-3-phosphate dehydrogenase [Chloroflexi bacterium RBG_16_48_8]